jgi:hypothetical protein
MRQLGVGGTVWDEAQMSVLVRLSWNNGSGACCDAMMSTGQTAFV